MYIVNRKRPSELVASNEAEHRGNIKKKKPDFLVYLTRGLTTKPTTSRGGK
jgi:hypothetical protein